jgi:hypothetical protein
VFDQVRQALLRPAVLLTGERAVAVRAPAPDDQLLDAQLGRLDRKAEAAQAEHRRLVDCYQAGLIELVELQRRVKELDTRRRAITEQRHALADQHDALAKNNRLRQRVGAFAERVLAALDGLDFSQRQQLLRLVVEEVRVSGWNVEIRLRIPLDDHPNGDPPRSPSPRGPSGPRRASSNDSLRSLGTHRVPVTPAWKGRPRSTPATTNGPRARRMTDYPALQVGPRCLPSSRPGRSYNAAQCRCRRRSDGAPQRSHRACP